MARLQVSVHDKSGKPTLARFRIRDHDGKSWAPEGAFERVSVITGDHYFYAPSRGTFTVPVPAGTVSVEVMKGWNIVRKNRMSRFLRAKRTQSH